MTRMSFNTGMSSTEAKMTEKDLKFALKVIKSAKKLGVKSMKLGNIEFEFGSEQNTRVGQHTLKLSAKSKAQAEETKLSLVSGSIRDEVSTMHLEDPLGFETAMVENLFVENSGDYNIEKTEGSESSFVS